MKIRVPKWVYVVLAPVVIFVLGYLALMVYYQKNIPYGTWVNDIYCTGLSYDEAAALILSERPYQIEIDVIDHNQVTHHMKLEDGMYSISYRENLEKKVLGFGPGKLFSDKYIIQNPTIVVKEETWKPFLQNQSFYQKEKIDRDTKRVYIKETESGFELVDLLGQVLDQNKAAEVIKKAIENRQDSVDLVESGCYFKEPYTEAESDVLYEYQCLQHFIQKFSCDITIQGEVYTKVDASVLKSWILKDKNGKYVYDKGSTLALDESAVKRYAETISEEVTTRFGKPWEFTTHDGTVVEVPAGSFGRVLEKNKLSKYLIDAFYSGGQHSYELEFVFYPESAKEVEYGAGYGNSYVEVDIEGQHVYVYKDGQEVLSTDVVTGDVRRDRLTPIGVYYIDFMQRNRVLKGENYRTPVSYWMHFYSQCGFHDAKWRKNFGGEIYVKDGSHGCVNMPPAKAKEMYGMVYKGMPVIVY